MEKKMNPLARTSSLNWVHVQKSKRLERVASSERNRKTGEDNKHKLRSEWV